MKKLIENTFKEFFNQEVRVINVPDEEIDMAIYVIRDKKTRKMSENELATYGFDYAITRSGKEFNNWIYMVAIYDSGSYSNPPDCQVNESIMTYKKAELALRDLILAIVKDNFQSLVMDWQMEQVNE